MPAIITANARPSQPVNHIRSSRSHVSGHALPGTRYVVLSNEVELVLNRLKSSFGDIGCSSESLRYQVVTAVASRYVLLSENAAIDSAYREIEIMHGVRSLDTLGRKSDLDIIVLRYNTYNIQYVKRRSWGLLHKKLRALCTGSKPAIFNIFISDLSAG